MGASRPKGVQVASSARRRSARMALVLLLSGLVVTVPGADAAFAAPTVAAFLPLSGPVGTSVTITGTGFTGATAVTFNGTSASFTVDNDLQITATVPAGATDGPIAVTAAGSTDASLLDFNVTPSPPTVLAFLPLSGPIGTSVTITGTGFTGATAVTFNGTPATFTVNLSTQITATVPLGATDGPIAVTTPGGTDASTLDFDVTDATATETHEREVTLALRRHLVASGRVTAQGGFDACEAGATVKVQRRRPGGKWRTVGTDTSNAKGVFRERVKDRPGVYRAIAVRKELNGGNEVCREGHSPRVKHRHERAAG
jgi:IPT/TIG domain-containing protein